jgi:hypothetical protein
MKKKLKKLFWISLVLFIVGEIGLRLYGFCNAPLYFSSKEFEYNTLPNQEGKRFGKNYKFNEFSQRSNSPSKKKKRILGLGDSVINGGVITEQDSLATSILSKNTPFQVLNISAGSWGPDNIAAYLNHYGTFKAQKMILVCSSHDSHDNMDFVPVVGKMSSYPSEQYSLAWIELIDRYLLPRIFGESEANQTIIKAGIEFNSGFDALLKISKSKKIPFTIYLHPDSEELKQKNYNEQGMEIMNWANENNVKIIKGLDYPFSSENYRDNIHLNESGQRILANALMSEVN